MKIQLQEGQKLAQDALVALGYAPERAVVISKHLIDSQMRGYPSAGFARILSIRDRLDGRLPVDRITVSRESIATAQLEGNDTLGYLVAQEATEKAIATAKKAGIAMVGANGTWYTGMLVYYAEMAAKEGLVTIIASNTTPWVAAHGGYRPINGTNPFCVGFPTSDLPVIYDIGTSKIIHADVLLAQRLGTQLPPDSAFDKDGNLTTDPWQVLEGSMAPWGGHKGTGLATVVQLLGVLAGSPASPPTLEQFGFTIIAVDPAMFRPIDDYMKEVDAYCKQMRESPTTAKDGRLRLPFERSAKQRQEALAADEVEIDERVFNMLKGIAVACSNP